MGKRFTFLNFLLLIILSVSLLSGCGFKKTAASITAQIMKDGIPSVEEEDDLGYANQTSLNSLKTLEAMQRANPSDSTLLLLLARSFASYTFGFVENDILEARGSNELLEKAATDRAKRFYSRGKKFGLLLLSKNKRFQKGVEGDFEHFQSSLNSLGSKDVPALFWTAFNWGSLINLSKDSPEAIIELPRVEAMMKRVAVLDEKYFFSGPNLFFGVFYGSRPKMLGGQPEASQEAFEKVMRDTQNQYLMAKVLYAQFYAVQMQDKALFEKTLKEVANTDAAALPQNQRLANEIAKRRAEILLNKENLFF